MLGQVSGLQGFAVIKPSPGQRVSDGRGELGIRLLCLRLGCCFRAFGSAQRALVRHLRDLRQAFDQECFMQWVFA